MTEKTPPSGDTRLEQSVRSSGFTPSVRHVPTLVEWLGSSDEAFARDVERALVRLGGAGVSPLVAHFERAALPIRRRLCLVIGRLAPESEGARRFVLDATADPDPKTRRNAIIAAGKLSGEDVEQVLLWAWDREVRPEHRRSIVASLGKVGGARARERLAALEAGADPALDRVAERARVMLERTARRSETSGIDVDRSPEGPLHIALECRKGLEPILAGELDASMAPRATKRGQVLATLRGPLRTLFQARTLLDVRFPLADERIRDGEDEASAIVRVLTSPTAQALIRTFTIGYARVRLAWVGGGHRRAVVWQVAKQLLERAGDDANGACIVNDPTSSTWEAQVALLGGFVRVDLVPRGIADTRFAYRKKDVPGASHPTMAAALVRVAGIRDDDVVWDPFVGGGTELVERAIGGRYARMFGSDVDSAALEVARTNLAAANVERVDLSVADATRWSPPAGVSLVLTNPPMGRRVARSASLAPTLDRFVEHAARVLRPGGRLVWISPFPARTRARGVRAGLRPGPRYDVDMGGFQAQIQRFDKP